MNDSFIMFITDMFFQREKDGKDAFLILKSSVALNALWKLYEKLVQVDVPPIESLSTEEKTKYWNIAKKYYDDKESAIIASKSSYILSLITNQ